MAKGYQAWVGVALGMLVLAAAFGGAYLVLSGDDVAIDGGQLSAVPQGAETAAVGGLEAAADLKSFTDGGGDLAMPASGQAGVALRVITDPTSVASLDPSTSSSSSTSSSVPASTPPATTASTAGATTTTTTATTTAAESSTTVATTASTVATTQTTKPTSNETTTTAAETTTTTMAATTLTTQRTTTTAKPPTTQVAGDARSFEQQVITLTNEARAASGCPALTHNDRLQAAALGHSKDMYEKDYFSHTSIDGSSMTDRVERQGYQWRLLAENIAYGYRTPSSVVDGWMNSSGHWTNILNCNLKEIGVGFHDYYWTQYFGTSR